MLLGIKCRYRAWQLHGPSTVSYQLLPLHHYEQTEYRAQDIQLKNRTSISPTSLCLLIIALFSEEQKIQKLRR